MCCRITAPHDGQNWKMMLGIKSNILRRMDTAPPGVRICCVKFVQVVVLVQTPGMVADPRVTIISPSTSILNTHTSYSARNKTTYPSPSYPANILSYPTRTWRQSHQGSWIGSWES